ncbi:MAG: glycosyltransferase [Candidatus Micrarchaeia archaeon]
MRIPRAEHQLTGKRPGPSRTARPFSVVVLNYNGRAIIERTLKAMTRETRAAAGSEIILVDNASTDGSADLVARKFPEVRVMRKREGRFLIAFNDAVAQAKNNVVILANNDMIPDKGCLGRLAAGLEGDVFAVGPKVLCRDHKTINFAFARPRFRLGFFWIERVGSGEPDRGQYDFQKPVPSVYPPIISAFSREKLLALGGFDPLYLPAYWEDVDLGYSAWTRGWKTLYDSKAVAVHDHQKTIEKGNMKSTVLYWINKNKHLFIVKNFSDGWMRAQYAIALPFIVVAGTIRHGFSFLSGFFGALGQVGTALGRNKETETHRKLSDREIFRRTGGKS